MKDDVDFTRYMSENFASFEYKTQEEALTVIKSLTSVLSTEGMQLMEILSPSHLLAQLHGPNHSLPHETPLPHDVAQGGAVPMVIDSGALPSTAEALPPPSPPVSAPTQVVVEPAMLRSSVVVAMVMLLKAHLKILYALSEE